MAEAILKNKQLTGVKVKSSGIFAINGSDASANAKKVLAENKIEHHHQSNSLKHADVDWASLILTMTLSHKAAIVEIFPEAAQKTYTLKEFTGESFQLDVRDPFGGDLDIYRRTFRELEELIDQAIDRLN
jgi:protein-tyrosine phosphatase